LDEGSTNLRGFLKGNFLVALIPFTDPRIVFPEIIEDKIYRHVFKAPVIFKVLHKAVSMPVKLLKNRIVFPVEIERIYFTLFAKLPVKCG
jgi:hypothetical protein